VQCPKCGYEGETRTIPQNKHLWACLTDVSRQVTWYGRRLSQWAWKDIFTAARKKQDVVPGIDGGFVVLGEHTSRMSKAEMSELLELIYAFGAEHKVLWSDPQYLDRSQPQSEIK
jgi:hypothetical protein